MTSFDHLLDYRLLEGSHPFPGEAGGACTNEVAVVVAGLDYREIGSFSDCPPCFSRPIAAYVLRLNDMMPDDVRQELKPFVTRLAGSADTPEIERRRGIVLANGLRRLGPSVTRAEISRALRRGELTLALGLWLSKGEVAAVIGRYADSAALQTGAGNFGLMADLLVDGLMGACAYCEPASGEPWITAIEMLDSALAIGRQAPIIDASLALGRLASKFSSRASVSA